MSQIEELKQVNFTTHLKTVLLAKRRANTTLEDYTLRKQRQESSTVKLNDQTICYICKSYYVNFVTTTCEHCFCEKCLFDHLLVCHKRCPQCKQVLRGTITTQTLNIDFLLVKSLRDDKEYQERVKEVEDWRNTLTIQELKPEMTLDVLDTEYIWCEGVVKQVNNNKQGQVKSLLIHYTGWNKVYDEIIQIQSKRLAPLGTYTGKKGVIQYQPSQSETLQRVLNTQRYSTTSSMFILQRLLQRWGQQN